MNDHGQKETTSKKKSLSPAYTEQNRPKAYEYNYAHTHTHHDQSYQSLLIHARHLKLPCYSYQDIVYGHHVVALQASTV